MRMAAVRYGILAASSRRRRSCQLGRARAITSLATAINSVKSAAPRLSPAASEADWLWLPRRFGAIDFWRGLILVVIIPGILLEKVSLRNFGLSDSAEVFVFLSGLTVGLAYHQRAANRGLAKVAEFGDDPETALSRGGSCIIGPLAEIVVGQTSMGKRS